MTPRHLALLVGLIALATLLLELTLVRLLSVALWYPFAFVALGTAMLGFGAAAAGFALIAAWRRLEAVVVLRRAALFFAAAGLGGYPLWNALGADPVSLAIAPRQLVLVGLLLLLVTLPFAGAGLFMARAFATYPRFAPTLYAADLTGGALGVLTYTVVFPQLGPGTLALAAALAVLAAACLPSPRRQRLILLSAAAALSLWSLRLERDLPLAVSSNKIQGGTERLIAPHWTVGSAVDLVAHGRERFLIIDGGTAVSELAYLAPGATPPAPRGLRALPYVLGATESTLVVGSGGGVEILAALGAGVKHVLALEIDHAIDDIVRRSTGSLLRPEVQLVDAEARSFLAATHQRFDAIVAFHTISNAASSTGGMALAENYLLTEEGIRLLFAHLDDNGVLVISRPEAQLGRLAATCAAAWPFADSIAPHVLAVAMGERLPSFLAALVITRRELSEDDIARLRSQTDRLVFSPKGGGDTQDFLADALAQKGHSTHASRLPYRPASLTPTRDDRPFFNLLQPWNELRLADLGAVLGSGRLGRARLEDLPVAQVAILLLLVEVLLFASPLWALTLWRLRQRGVAPRRLFATFAYFAALGLAYMLLELGLVQELTRLLGMPAHSLVAVLATLLCATGTGSLLLAGKCHVGPARGAMLALVAAVLVGVAVAPIVDAAAPLGFAARIAVAVGVVAIVGFLLGAPFAAGLARLEDPQLVAVAWSANSMASVAGSVAALIISSAVGFGTAALLAAGCYAVAALVGRRHNQPQ